MNDNVNNDCNERTVRGGVEGTPGLVHHIIEVGGGPMSVYEAGDPTSPKVVLLHGAMYDEARFIWDQMFPCLSERYHVFAVDTPRHGKSRPWEGRMSHTRLMDILCETFERLKLERFSLIGLSMGGALSVSFASLHPQSVTSMAVFEPGGLGDKIDSQLLTWLYIKTPGVLRLLNRRYAKASDASVMKTLKSVFVAGASPVGLDGLMSILKDEMVGKFDNAENDMDDWQRDMVGPFKLKWNILSAIPQIKCPSLWLRGADSTLVKQGEMERAVALAREGGATARLEVIENAGHLLPLEQPALANQAVLRFLESTT